MHIFDYFASIIERRFMTDLKDYISNDYKAIDTQETIRAVQDFFDDLTFHCEWQQKDLQGRFSA